MAYAQPTPATQAILDLLAKQKGMKLSDSSLPPENEQEEMLLILRGFRKSLVSDDYWVKYE